MDCPDPPTRTPALRNAFADQSGFTIIEVLVAALVLAIAAAGAATAFAAAVGSSGTARDRSVAEALAQRDENRLRGDTVDQLSNLNQNVTAATTPSGCPTTTTVKLDGTCYTVHESATFVSDSAGAPSCTNPSVDYLETTSTVTWDGMPSSENPVRVTGVITPTSGEISSEAGVLAVDVVDQAGNPLAGMDVTVSGPGTASGVTASNGCVLFGDLPVGTTYTVSVEPPSGTYVDASSDQVVKAGSPDKRTDVQVSQGTTAASPTPFELALPGWATFSFSDVFPAGVAPSPTPIAIAPPVILVASGKLSSFIACSVPAGCKSGADPDPNWLGAAASGPVVASDIAPYTYETYAGICTNDDPSLAANGAGADVPAAVSSGQNIPVSISLASIVVRLYSGTGTPTVANAAAAPPVGAGSEMALPSGSTLVITDTGCGEQYVGGPDANVPNGDLSLPISTSPIRDGGANDIGLLADPGMPDGQYSVCYESGGEVAQTTLTNSGNGEVVNLFNGSLTTGTCPT